MIFNLISFLFYRFIKNNKKKAYGSGQMAILDGPDAILFKKTDKIEGDYIGDAFRAFMGYSITKSVPLKVRIENPFELAEHVCFISMFGVNNIEPQQIKPKSEIQLIGPVNTEPLIEAIEENHLQYLHVNLADLEDAVS